MQQLLETIRDFARDNSMKLISAALFTLFGWMFGRWRATRSWKRREFFNRLNISLNTIHDGKLLIRTVLEKTCENPVHKIRWKTLQQLQKAHATDPAWFIEVEIVV